MLVRAHDKNHTQEVILVESHDIFKDSNSSAATKIREIVHVNFVNTFFFFSLSCVFILILALTLCFFFPLSC